MISNLNEYNEINKIIRNQLLTQTGLANDHVLNGLDFDGINLEKRLDDQIFVSFSLLDNFIIFNLVPRTSTSNISQDIEDDIYNVSSFMFKLIIYGKSSMKLAQIIKSRFLTEEVRHDLYKSGIYIEDIDNPVPTNEFVNSKIYTRTDFSINISCESKFEKITQPTMFEEINEVSFYEFDKRISDTSGNIVGCVKSVYTGLPINNLEIKLVFNNDYTFEPVLKTVRTDENGNYEFNSVAYSTNYAIIIPRGIIRDGQELFTPIILDTFEKINILRTAYYYENHGIAISIPNIITNNDRYNAILYTDDGNVVDKNHRIGDNGNINYYEYEDDNTNQTIASIIVENKKEDVLYRILTESTSGFSNYGLSWTFNSVMSDGDLIISSSLNSLTKDSQYWNICSIKNEEYTVINSYNSTLLVGNIAGRVLDVYTADPINYRAVGLYKSSRIATAFTDSNGQYSFNNLDASDEYVIAVNSPDSSTRIYQDVGEFTSINNMPDIYAVTSYIFCTQIKFESNLNYDLMLKTSSGIIVDKDNPIVGSISYHEYTKTEAEISYTYKSIILTAISNITYDLYVNSDSGFIADEVNSKSTIYRDERFSDVSCGTNNKSYWHTYSFNALDCSLINEYVDTI